MIVDSDRSLLPESSVLHNHGSSIYPAIELLSGTSNPNLARGVGQMLGLEIDWPIHKRFSNGQMHVQISNPLHKCEVIIIQSTATDTDILELQFMIAAARRASAKEITAIIPYYGYAQSDRKTAPGETIGAADLAGIYEYLGIKRLVTIDPHYDQIAGTTSVPFDILFSSYAMIPAIQKILETQIHDKKIVVIAPDEGAVKRNSKLSMMLGNGNTPLAGGFSKYRDPDTGKPNSKSFNIQPVENLDALIFDDVWCSGNSMFNAVESLIVAKAKDIYVAVPHAFFADDSLKRLSDSAIKMVFISNTLNLRPEILEHPKIFVIDVAPLLAHTILDIFTGAPHTDLFL